MSSTASATPTALPTATSSPTSDTQDGGNISGIVVVTTPAQIAEAINQLQSLPGVEVHHQDTRGKIIITQEAATVGDEIAGLKKIKALPAVRVAEMVYHYFEDSFDTAGDISGASPDDIPEALRDTPGLDKELVAAIAP